MINRSLIEKLNLPPNYGEPLIIKSIDTLIEAASYINRNEDFKEIKRAALYAQDKFSHIKRKNGDPYFYHLLTTAYYIAKWECSPAMIIAALLHDLIEDIKDETYETVAKNFTKEIAFLVDKLTKVRKFEKTHSDIYGENMRKILLGMARDVRVMVIKMADRLNNIETLFYLRKEKQLLYAKETVATYVPIAQSLGFNKWANTVSTLCLWYTNQKEYLDIYTKVQKIASDNEKVVEKTIAIIKKTLQEHGVKFNDIYGRKKSIISIKKKILRKGSINNINDILAIRIICATTNDCYAILGTIHQQFDVIQGRYKDYIIVPKGNMYQSLHTVVNINDYQFEIQIRTDYMHEVAEKGIAAHWRYKEATDYSYQKQQKEIINKIHILKNIIKFDQLNSDDNVSDFQWWKDLQEEILCEQFICVTPNKKPIELKAGASVLDFAFHIHTEVGLNAIKGIVNGKVVPLKTSLQAGDVVEIITQNKPNFSDKWISWVVTPTAKNKLKKALKQRDYKKTTDKEKEEMEKGFKVLQKYLEGTNLWNVYQDKKKQINEFIMQLFQLPTMDQIYIKLAHSRKYLPKIYNHIFTNYLTNDKKLALTSKKIKKKDVIKDDEIIIDGISGIKIQFAKCCSPIYGDDIITSVSKRSGLKIHLKTCPNVQNPFFFLDFFDASWGSKGTQIYPITLAITTLNNKKTTNQLINLFSSLNVVINKLTTKVISESKALTKAHFLVKTVYDLDKIVKAIKEIKDVYDVIRA